MIRVTRKWKVWLICQFCGEPYLQVNSQVGRSKFCSLECYNKSNVKSETMRTKRTSPEFNQKLKDSYQSPELKQLRRNQLEKNSQDPEFQRKRIENLWTPEFRQKQSELWKELRNDLDSDFRKNNSKAMGTPEMRALRSEQ